MLLVKDKNRLDRIIDIAAIAAVVAIFIGAIIAIWAGFVGVKIVLSGLVIFGADFALFLWDAMTRREREKREGGRRGNGEAW